ncbi:MAG: hypothetical protein IKI69_00945, partial [Oscillospiraceae bacterium]|nr:hypothetical protein [Oscillospiraceae bacterium]
MGKEEERSGYGAFAQSAEAKRSEFLPTQERIWCFRALRKSAMEQAVSLLFLPKRSPAARVRLGKEEERSGYGAFAQSAEAKRSEFLPTQERIWSF